MIGMGQHIAIYPREAWLAIESDMATGDATSSSGSLMSL